MTWNDAKAYADWLSKKAGSTYRLLSKGEWEFAARANGKPIVNSLYSYGSDISIMCQNGNGADQSTRVAVPVLTAQLETLIRSGLTDRDVLSKAFFPCNDGFAYTAPVGRFLPNDFGLYDMHGNVSEWVEDCDNGSYRGAPIDGSAWTLSWRSGSCGPRVTRGGSWRDRPELLRVISRGSSQSRQCPASC